MQPALTFAENVSMNIIHSLEDMFLKLNQVEV